MNKLQWQYNQNIKIVFMKMHLKISSATWRPFCSGVDELSFKTHGTIMYIVRYIYGVCSVLFYIYSSLWTWVNFLPVFFKTDSHALAQMFNMSISQIPQFNCSAFQNTSFRPEMCTFLFWIVHCRIKTGTLWDLWSWSIVQSLAN